MFPRFLASQGFNEGMLKQPTGLPNGENCKGIYLETTETCCDIGVPGLFKINPGASFCGFPGCGVDLGLPLKIRDALF